MADLAGTEAPQLLLVTPDDLRKLTAAR